MVQIGRAGRGNTKGLAISFVSTDKEKEILKKIQDKFIVKISELPDTINTDDYSNIYYDFK